MKIVRTIVWVLLLVALLIFSINNWNPIEVKIWEGLVLETKIPALVVVAFLIGLVPMWLLYRATSWNYERRLSSLESAARASAMAQAAPPSPAPDAGPAPAPAPTPQPLPEEPRTDLSPTEEPKPNP